MLVVHGSNSSHNQSKLQKFDQQNFNRLKAGLAGRHVEKIFIDNDILYTGLINKQGEATDDIGIIEYVAKGTIFAGKVVNGKPAGQGRLAKGNVTIADGFLFWNPKTNTIEKAKDTIEKGQIENKENRFPISMAAGFLTASQRETEMQTRQLEDEYYVGDRNIAGEKHGQGILRFSDNVYSGELKNGLFDGKGEISYAKGNKYTGEFQKGLKSGKGIYKFYDTKSGKLVEFDGTFDDDRFEGEIHYPNGTKYIGQALNLLRDGLGKFYGLNGFIYDGEWQKGLRHGNGKQWSEGNQCEGEFDRDEFKSGNVIYGDGGSYKGEFADGQKHGKGIAIYKNENVYTGDFKKGQRHGKGVFTYKDGGSFDGEWKNNKPDGKGTFIYKNKDEYVGDFLEGLRDGNGTFTYSNGDTYTGGFLKGKFHGKGVLIQLNHLTYEGDFLNGLRDGQGTCINHQHGHVYEGDWVKGKYEGQGILKAKHFTYEGAFLNGLKHGQGKLIELEYRDSFEGEWEKDAPAGKFTVKSNKYLFTYKGDFFAFKRHGNGRCEYTCGEIYDGDWVKDKFDGQGVWKNKKETCTGQFVKGHPHGHVVAVNEFGRFEGFYENGEKKFGIFKFNVGGEYTGNWLNDDIHGYGTLNYANGDVYEGNFAQGKTQGYGVLHEVTGQKYEGNWAKDKREGFGIIQYANGTKYEGLWKDGLWHGYGIFTIADGAIFSSEFQQGKIRGLGTFYSKEEIVAGRWLDSNFAKGVRIDQHSSYVGELKDHRPEGLGKLFHKDGRVYEGIWVDGAVYNYDVYDKIFK